MAHIKEATKTASRNIVSRDQEWFSIGDLAQLFGTSKQTVTKWLRDGELDPYFRREMTVRVPRASVEAFIAKNLASIAAKQAESAAQ